MQCFGDTNLYLNGQPWCFIDVLFANKFILILLIQKVEIWCVCNLRFKLRKPIALIEFLNEFPQSMFVTFCEVIWWYDLHWRLQGNPGANEITATHIPVFQLYFPDYRNGLVNFWRCSHLITYPQLIRLIIVFLQRIHAKRRITGMEYALFYSNAGHYTVSCKDRCQRNREPFWGTHNAVDRALLHSFAVQTHSQSMICQQTNIAVSKFPTKSSVATRRQSMIFPGMHLINR